SAAGRRTETCDDDAEGEAATVAVPSTLPPAARVPSSAAPARRSWSSAKWPRPVFTFALGAILGAQYFSPSRPNWPAAENAQATELSPKAVAPDQACASECPNIEAVLAERIAQLVGVNSCGAKAALAEAPPKDVDLEPASLESSGSVWSN